MRIILRKLGSLINNFIIFFRSKFYRFIFSTFQNGIKIDKDVKFGKNVNLRVTDGGRLKIMKGVNISSNTSIIVQSGILKIFDNVFIGNGSIIVCRKSILIGKKTLVSEYVTIRDQDHDYSNGIIESNKFKTSSIVIGSNCWIGAKSSILRGSVLGDSVIIGSHALVKSKIPSFNLATGIPAIVKKSIK
ncbi:MAG: hypothetical protein CMF98_06255 [Candidatus Marinimicrobia bacterium]|nr:hypothetical protein [Candidatus Neomarinimicrobiota bacterium]RPG13263.1 MAG: hypothetical protein CBD92_000055 [Pelagibacteraceae bacterium TMED232]|tara:strand:- start:1314 stop:1880 length:567 start_codon:yes stop_codon:yes gene_type:complete